MSKLLSGCRVLVIDDEFLVMMSVEAMLEDIGCDSINTAGNVKDAIGMVSQHRFDLATLDVNLNGERSFAVADALIALDIPFVFTTGYTDLIENSVYRHVPVLHKPYSFEKFVAALTGLLARPAAA